MASLLFNGVGVLLVGGALAMLGYKATTQQPLCTEATPQALCAAQYLTVLLVLMMWVSSLLCASPTLAKLLSVGADMVLLGLVVSLFTTDAASFVDYENPQRIVGNAMIVVLAVWRLSIRLNEMMPSQPSYGYGSPSMAAQY